MSFPLSRVRRPALDPRWGVRHRAARHGTRGATLKARGGALAGSCQEVIEQPKRTFTFPWRRWLRGPLGLQVAMRLGRITPSLAEMLDREEVHSVWRSFLMGRTGWARPWSLFVLNEWVRCHVDDQQMPQELDRSVAMAVPGALA